MTRVNRRAGARATLVDAMGAVLKAVLLALCMAGARAAPLSEDFAAEVDRRLEPPVEEQAYYGALLGKALDHTAARTALTQYFVLVDRSPSVQAAMIYWRAPDGSMDFVGAAPASTGKPGRYEHFVTPTGVFEHSRANPDFRAEGTRNSQGILGYGEKGMRVYDFGWVKAQRGWGAGGWSEMRLQMHATDPKRLEPKLGAPGSKGCIRIPASFNVFIDRHGLLDADYEAAALGGEHPWVLLAERVPTLTPGRWLVVIDSGRTAPPAWTRSP